MLKRYVGSCAPSYIGGHSQWWKCWHCCFLQILYHLQQTFYVFHADYWNCFEGQYQLQKPLDSGFEYEFFHLHSTIFKLYKIGMFSYKYEQSTIFSGQKGQITCSLFWILWLWWSWNLQKLDCTRGPASPIIIPLTRTWAVTVVQISKMTVLGLGLPHFLHLPHFISPYWKASSFASQVVAIHIWYQLSCATCALWTGLYCFITSLATSVNTFEWLCASYDTCTIVWLAFATCSYTKTSLLKM